jgi:hypothetical protein
VPVATVIVHSDPAGSDCVLRVNVRVAETTPEYVGATTNVEEPHPLVDGVSRLESVAYGRTSAMVSSTSRFAFNENEYTKEVALCIEAFVSFSVLDVSAGSSTAVEAATYVLMFVASASVTVMTLSAKFAT